MIRVKRKVIQIAGSTQLVSLPRKWSKKNNIKKGQELEVIERGSSLVIRYGNPEDDEIKKTVNLEQMEPYLKYILHGFYKSGYSQITFFYDDEKYAENIQKILREEVIGFEIVEQSSKSCIVKAVAGALSSEFDSMLKRAFMIDISMYEGIMDVFKTRKKSTLNSLIYMESTNNKYASFCKRMLNKNLVDTQKTGYLYILVSAIERIADELKYLCYDLIKNPVLLKGIKPEILKQYSNLYTLLKSSKKIFFDYDLFNVLKNFDMRKKILADTYNIVNSSSGNDARLLHYIINLTQNLLTLNRSKMEMEL